MDLEGEWRASRIAYTELVFRPILHSGYSVRDLGSEKAVRRAVAGASLNKAIFAVFTMAGALFPFLLYATRLEDMTLSVSVSLSLLLVLGYIVLYCVQVLPSFVSTGSFAPLTLLPLSVGTVSRVAGMTLWRTLDYILIASLISQVAAAAYFTGSPFATALVCLASIASSILAVGLSLWLTRVFQERLEVGALSGLRALARPLYFVLWGLGVMSAVFLFSLVSYAAPPLESALAAPGSLVGFVLSLLLPFSVGLLSAQVHGQTISTLSWALGLTGLALAALGSVVASGFVLRTITRVALPQRILTTGETKEGLRFSVRGPLSAYLLKDVRVASRNPATGFLFALPIFEIIAVVLPLTVEVTVKVSVLLVGAQVGASFALFITFLLVTVEDFGVERKTALPFRESVRTLSKAVISTAAYLPVPLALCIILLGKPETFAGGFALPLVAALSVFAASVVEVVVIRWLAEGGHGNALRFAAGVGSGELVALAPSVAYTFSFVLTRAHLESLALFSLCTVAELALAWMVLRTGDRRASGRVSSRGPGPGAGSP